MKSKLRAEGTEFYLLMHYVTELLAPWSTDTASFRLLDNIIEQAESNHGTPVTPWPLKDPKWDGLGQLLYSVNMVYRGNEGAWKMVGSTAKALRELLEKS